MKKDTMFVWFDLEMTGLSPQRDVILEVAAAVSDVDLTIIAELPSIIIQQPADVLSRMEPKIHGMHQKSGLLVEVATSSISLTEASNIVYAFVKTHIAGSRAILAGNSIWNDRLFLQQYMPHILELLHYRILDVSTVKELVNNWYPHVPQFEKQKRHRALEDIHESIAELKHYRTHFFV